MINGLVQKPHPVKQILVNELKLSIMSISKYLGITYPYTCNILSGFIMTKKHDAKLWELVENMKKKRWKEKIEHE